MKCCQKQYVGWTWRQLNIRFNIHRKQAGEKQTQFCELVCHVVQQGLSFVDVEITIIEQLKESSNLTEAADGTSEEQGNILAKQAGDPGSK